MANDIPTTPNTLNTRGKVKQNSTLNGKDPHDAIEEELHNSEAKIKAKTYSREQKGNNKDSANNFSRNGHDKKEKANLSDFEIYRITDCTPIPEPVPIITISGETISTEGNITTISGASKSGKSAFSGWTVAGAISLDGIINDPLDSLVITPNPNRKAVIHIDTEQAKHKQQYNVRSILHRVGIKHCPDHFLSYNIRQLNINQYAEITTGICEAASLKFGGIHLIVIDGIADYIYDPNEQDQSNAIVKYFEELAIKYNTPIIVVVHTNPGSDKERGHIGSQCQRKSESVLSIKKDEDDISYLEPKLLRSANKCDIPMIQFRYDKNKGYHVGSGVRGNDLGKGHERLMRLKILSARVFAPPVALKYEDAIKKIMKETGKGERSAKDMFKEMRDPYEMIVQGEDKFWRLNMGQNDETEEPENDKVQ